MGAIAYVARCGWCQHQSEASSPGELEPLMLQHTFACAKHPLAPFRDFALQFAERPCEVPDVPFAWACINNGGPDRATWCLPCQARAIWEDHGLTVNKEKTS
jgi:hypothetical protein